MIASMYISRTALLYIYTINHRYNDAGCVPMRRKAKVMNILPKGDVLLRYPEPMTIPKRKLGIFDNRNRRIADVIKIFGPTDSPFIRARPRTNGNRFITLVGKELFMK